jgi:hypothetical protein
MIDLLFEDLIPSTLRHPATGRDRLDIDQELDRLGF